MRISSALLTAAMILSGIVVIEANPASAQSYVRGYTSGYQTGYQAPTYQQPGYQGGYVRPAEVTYADDTVGYQPVPRYGYGATVVSQPVYDAPRYAAPTYVRPAYAQPTYVTQTYVTPAEPCHDRGW